MSDHFDVDEFTCHPADECQQMTPADLPPLPETNTVPRDYYTREQIQSYAKLAVREALERAAKACDDLGSKYRNLYKGRTDPVDRDRCYNPHTDGLSDGAWECEAAIRAMIEEYK